MTTPEEGLKLIRNQQVPGSIPVVGSGLILQLQTLQAPPPMIYAYDREPYRTRLDVQVLAVGEEDGRPYAVLANAARAMKEQLRESQRRGRALEERLAIELADALAARGQTLSDLHVDDAEGGFLQQLAARFEKRSATGAALLTAAGAKGAFFVVVAGPSSGLDVRTAGAQVAVILGGRGGGSSRLFQGKAGDLARRGEALAAIAAALETRPGR